MIARYRFSYSSFRYSVHLYKLPPTDKWHARRERQSTVKSSSEYCTVETSEHFLYANVASYVCFDVRHGLLNESTIFSADVGATTCRFTGTVELWSRGVLIQKSWTESLCEGERSVHSTLSTCQPSDVRSQVAIAELSTVETPPSTTSCYSVAATFHWRLISVSSVFLP